MKHGTGWLIASFEQWNGTDDTREALKLSLVSSQLLDAIEKPFLLEPPQDSVVEFGKKEEAPPVSSTVEQAENEGLRALLERKLAEYNTDDEIVRAWGCSHEALGRYVGVVRARLCAIERGGSSKRKPAPRAAPATMLAQAREMRAFARVLNPRAEEVSFAKKGEKPS